MDLQQRDAKYLGRSDSVRQVVVGGAQGSFVYDEKGRKYIDFYMGWSVGNVGWNIEEIMDSVRNFSGPTYIDPSYIYEDWVTLAELLAKITPGKLTKSFRATGGTEAVEIALQAAMSHTKRHKFISLEGSYHGHSIGAMSIGASFFRDWYSNLLPDCYKIDAPFDAEAGRKVEELLSKGDIAAYISEPIVCNLGAAVPTQEYFDIVSSACKKYGTVFIIDEVASGFGRSGKMFASELYGLEPDIMVLAKGISGGHGGLGATIMTEEVAKSFEFDFSFYSTFGWNPINVRAAIKNIEYMLKHKERLFKNAEKVSAYIEKRLHAMTFKKEVKINVTGLAIGIVFDEKEYPSKIVSEAQEKGLLLCNAGSSEIILFPSLDLDEETLKEGMDILESCL